MCDIRANHETVRVRLGEEVSAAFLRAGHGFADAGDGAREEVAACALAEEGTNFFVVEEGGHGDDAVWGVVSTARGGGVCCCGGL